MPRPEVARVQIATAGLHDEGIVRQAVRAVYDIRRDDTALRETLALPPEQRAPRFEQIRKSYPRRREFDQTTVVLEPPDASAAAVLRALRFRVE